ncbi:MAG: GldM family protein [Bacteroidota bacterium]|nr:GldM family protein [Bacteroidota bacterium]
MHKKSNRTIIYVALWLLPVFFGFQQTVFAQCDETLIKKAIDQSGIDAYFLKEFKIKYTKAKTDDPAKVAKFSAYLIRGNLYRFNIENARQYESKAVMQLFQRGHLLAGNLDLDKQIYSNSFEFSCSKSGNYHILMSFIEGKPGCAAGIMSLVVNDTTNLSDFGISEADSVESLYIGIDNELYIAATNEDSLQLKVSVSKGEIEGQNGNYIVHVFEKGFSKITACTINSQGDTIEESSKIFKISNLPKPVITFAGSRGGIIRKQEMLRANSLEALWPENIPEAGGTIISFAMSKKMFSSEKYYSSDNKLTYSQKKFIKTLPKGSNFFIRDIVFKQNQGVEIKCRDLGFIVE